VIDIVAHSSEFSRMFRHHFMRVLLGLLLPAVLVACAPHTQYRTDYTLCVNSSNNFTPLCEKSALQEFPLAKAGSYQLHFVELDDQGQIWDRRQMWAVLDKISTQAAQQDVLMLVFVHGWKNNAAPGNGNIETFRKVLSQLALDESHMAKLTGFPARPVVGVFLGWRGATLTTPLIENLTFWNRKATAQQVGHVGTAEILSRLEQIKTDKWAMSQGTSETRLAVIGHSFGGAVVHTALAQILSNRFIQTTGAAGVQGDVKGFGDLVVLVNPAFEAALFAPLSDMATERGRYFESQAPVMAILTSQADMATGLAFPAGRYVSTLGERVRKVVRFNAVTGTTEVIQQAGASVTAVGHFLPYRTHRLYPADNTKRRDIAQTSYSEATLQDDMAALVQAADGWRRDKPGNIIKFPHTLLERTANSAGRNPYMVINVSKELITDHSDLDDPRVIEFVRELILISMQTPQRAEQMQRVMAGK
jgi:pimeloyl-ACP methyl ester carboxylesterase